MLKAGAPVEPIVLRAAAGRVHGRHPAQPAARRRSRPRRLQAPARHRHPGRRRSGRPDHLQRQPDSPVQPGGAPPLPRGVRRRKGRRHGHRPEQPGQERLGRARPARPDPDLPVVRGRPQPRPGLRRASTWSPPRWSSAGPTSPGRRDQAGAEGARGRDRHRAGRLHLDRDRSRRRPPDRQRRGAEALDARQRHPVPRHRERRPRPRDGGPEGHLPPVQGRHAGGDDRGRADDRRGRRGFRPHGLNYGSEPLWFRFGLQPNSALTGGHGLGPSLADVANAHEAFSNALGGGDPATPVYTARPGQPVRLHLLEPSGSNRASTFTLHGHLWQRAPYVCPGSSKDGLAGKCKATGFYPPWPARSAHAPSGRARSRCTWGRRT